ncbi:ribosomal protein L21-like protein [Catenaria anguillulae PL171]|uniref:Large ribosomal subunit protein bL21m n=1 Tax=Catenaria anguillulae PL171 TaxID=765915 RepID=A0A1Y2I2N2_9FUNG|nr:ribosomal protein L21-like protein [Catenaria anguillulae PL171]
MYAAAVDAASSSPTTPDSASTPPSPTNPNVGATSTPSPASAYLHRLATSGGPYYALLELKGRPFHLTKGDLLTVPRLKDVPLGAELALDKVREIGSKEISLRGAPYVSPNVAQVKAVVVEHWLSAKRTTVKEKRRKGYKRTYGHRMHLTSLRVTEVAVNEA